MPQGHDPFDALHEDIRDLRAEVGRLSERQAATDVKVTTQIDAFRQERDGAAIYRREVRETLGELTEQQNRTSGKVDALADDFHQERESARKHYTDLTAVIAALSGSVKTLAETVQDMKPTVDAVVIRKHKDAGRRELLHQQWGVILVIAGFFTWLIGAIMGWWPQLWNWMHSR